VKIAIIGSGIAGNTLAHHLHAQHDVHVFEAGSHVGGHSDTHDIEVEGRPYTVDTGFIVYNERTYPNFSAMLKALDVPTQESSMGFSVRCERSGLEYNGNTINSLFAQRRNLFRPAFWRMIRQILRFNREAPALLDSTDDGEDIELGAYLPTISKADEATGAFENATRHVAVAATEPHHERADVGRVHGVETGFGLGHHFGKGLFSHTAPS
jgi:predicted NAD/FAD-binding protein